MLTQRLSLSVAAGYLAVNRLSSSLRVVSSANARVMSPIGIHRVQAIARGLELGAYWLILPFSSMQSDFSSRMASVQHLYKSRVAMSQIWG